MPVEGCLMIISVGWSIVHGSNLIVQSYCSIDGYEFTDAIFQTIKATLFACAIYCQKMSNCQSYSYNSQQGTCSLNGYSVPDSLLLVATAKLYAPYLCTHRGKYKIMYNFVGQCQPHISSFYVLHIYQSSMKISLLNCSERQHQVIVVFSGIWQNKWYSNPYIQVVCRCIVIF